MPLRLKAKSKAFSLAELIITVAILSTGVVIAIQAIAISARTAGLSLDVTEAVFIAQDKMQELEFEEQQNNIQLASVPVPGESIPDTKFSWAYSITKQEDPDLNTLGFNLYKAECVITWERAKRKQDFEVVTTYVCRQNI